jgi:hypothetical protein
MGFFLYFTFTLFPVTAVLLGLLLLPMWSWVRKL